MSRTRKHTLILWLITIAWTALLFALSGQNGEESAGLSEMLTRFVLRIFPALPLSFDTLHILIRKTAHFTIFGVEGALLLCALMRSLRGRISACIAVPACALIAALNEYHQSFTEGRHASFIDVGIDFAGAACAMLLIRWMRKKKSAKAS